MPFQKVALVHEVPPGEVTEAVLDDRLYAICNVDGELRVTSGLCPHSGGPLGQGALHGGFLTCPWHMWQFDSKTGECAFNRAIRIPTYPVQVQNGEIWADLPHA